jgi:hypothetical protein
MDGHDSFRGVGDGVFDSAGVEVEVEGVDVGEDRGSPAGDDAGGGGDEGEGGGDDLVAGADSVRLEGDNEGGGAELTAMACVAPMWRAKAPSNSSVRGPASWPLSRTRMTACFLRR